MATIEVFSDIHKMGSVPTRMHRKNGLFLQAFLLKTEAEIIKASKPILVSKYLL